MTSSSGNIASGTGVQSDSSSIKVATPELILFNSSSLSVDAMANLIFEDIGGQELLEISRSDLINSANVIFPRVRVAPTSVQSISANAGAGIPLPSNSIDLLAHLPKFENPVEFNNLGGLEIKVIDFEPNYRIEFQIVSKASRFDDTIYSEDEGEED
jgi:hypothetical protein